MPKGIGYKGSHKMQLSELRTKVKPNVDDAGALSALKRRQKATT